MDTESIRLIRRVWKHSGVDGLVWMPKIAGIGTKKPEFREGEPLRSLGTAVPQMDESVDWYWTPAVSSGQSRKAEEYQDQRVLWVDCDEGYDQKILEALKPSFMWETSPGHRQAIWLMKESVDPSEFHRDGLMGMLTDAVGADKSGVDISQLLRVPGTWHHKREPFLGRVLRTTPATYTRGQLLTRAAKALGISAGLASELGATDPYGDRSKVLWRLARNAEETGIPEQLTFKLLRACNWNKWKGNDERLKEDIAKAYASRQDQPTQDTSQGEAASVSAGPWEMSSLDEFGPVVRSPLKWVLPGIIPQGGCGLIVAAPKVGKTRIAIEMALGLSTGTNPLGISVQRQQEIGVLSLEDGQYLFSSRIGESLNRDRGRDQYHWDGHIRWDGSTLRWHPAQPVPLLTRFDPVDLSDVVDQQSLYDTIVARNLKLVIIDTLSMAIGKADVSASKDMYAILKNVKTIAKATDCAILFIHHTRKRQFEKGESVQETILGSTALHAWADFIMSLATPKDDDDIGLLRLSVQTKMGGDTHYLSPELKIIRKPGQD